MLNLRFIPTIATLLVSIMAFSALRYMHQQPWGETLFFISFSGLVITLIYWVYATLPENKRSVKVGIALMLTATLMFGFSYGLVPFYHVMCKFLGINSEITNAEANTTNSKVVHGGIPTHTILTFERGMRLPVTVYPKNLALSKNQLYTQTLIVSNPTAKTQKIRIKVAFSPGALSRALHPINSIQNRAITLAPHQTQDIKIDWLTDATLPKLTEANIHFAFFPIVTRSGA